MQNFGSGVSHDSKGAYAGAGYWPPTGELAGIREKFVSIMLGSLGRLRNYLGMFSAFLSELLEWGDGPAGTSRLNLRLGLLGSSPHINASLVYIYSIHLPTNNMTLPSICTSKTARATTEALRDRSSIIRSHARWHGAGNLVAAFATVATRSFNPAPQAHKP
jgi:hypothetical protein